MPGYGSEARSETVTGGLPGKVIQPTPGDTQAWDPPTGRERRH